MDKGDWGSWGEKSRTAKLNEAQVRNIKKLLRQGVTYRELAVTFGVSLGTIAGIAKRQTWIHVKETDDDTEI